MTPSIGVQLYSVREEMKKDFAGTVRKIADMGYAGVETAGFPGSTPQAAAQLFRDLGLKAFSGHLPLPVGDRQKEAIETAQIIGAEWVVSGFGPNDFKTADLIKATCDKFNQAAANAAAAGLKFALHNHWWEFESLDGRPVYKTMLQHLQPNVHFQIDAYWVQTAGLDPAAVVAELGGRVRLLHAKDGPCQKGVPMTALGEGKVNFDAVAKAGTYLDWMVVELDACATDMMEAVAKSYRFLTGRKLAKGRK
jgi:sugar phosphate isomerase/epimerase